MDMLFRDVDGDITTDTHFNPETKKVTVHRQQDVTQYLERAKELRKDWDGKGKNRYYVASIPNIVLEGYCKDKGIPLSEMYTTGINRIIVDPDYSGFRIFKGNV